MSLFGKKPQGDGYVTRSQADYVRCEDNCRRCGLRNACTRQVGHELRWHGHSSNASVVIQAHPEVKGCGHEWGGEHS